MIQILVASNVGSSEILKLVKECSSGVNITTVQRHYFNDSRGLSIIKHLAAPNSRYVERHLSTK